MNAIDATLTVFVHPLAKAAKADKADDAAQMTNSEFLAAVFHTLPEGARPGWCSFLGNPHKVPRGAWFAKPWDFIPHAVCGGAGHNTYFAISSYYNNDAGEFRRTKGSFAALHCIYLDDVGAKVDSDRITLAPSWLLETSAGNHQMGFVLAEPLASMGNRHPSLCAGL